MRSPPPSDDNSIEKLPTRRFRVLSLLDLQVQPVRPIFLYEAFDERVITLPQHVVVFGLPHAKRRQNATFKVVPSGDSAADAETSFLFSTPPSVSTDGTLSFVLRPGLYGKGYGYSYGNASFSLQMSTTDDEVYGLCASQDLDDKSDIGGHVEKSCVTSRLYAGRRPYNEHNVLQSRPVANFITTNFSIVVWPVHNAQYFQVKIPSPRKFLEYLKNFHYDTHLTFIIKMCSLIAVKRGRMWTAQPHAQTEHGSVSLRSLSWPTLQISTNRHRTRVPLRVHIQLTCQIS
jgi:hypothetical protein